MAVAIRLTCDGGDCTAYAATWIGETGFAGSSVMVDNGSFLVESTWLDLPDGWGLDTEGKAYCPAHLDAPPHSCEAALKARPDWSPNLGTPVIFACSCGKVYAFRSEESEGADWVALDLKEHPLHPRGCPSHPDGSRCLCEGEHEPGCPWKDACAAPAVRLNKSPGGTETWLCEKGHRVAVGK